MKLKCTKPKNEAENPYHVPSVAFMGGVYICKRCHIPLTLAEVNKCLRRTCLEPKYELYKLKLVRKYIQKHPEVKWKGSRTYRDMFPHGLTPSDL
jgi:hypothetical protein